MLPVTAFYAGLCAVFFVWLAWRVTVLRRKYRLLIGDGGHEDMARAIRVHCNFAEYVPLALILLGLAEMHKAPLLFLHVMGAALVLGRVLHAYSLIRSEVSTGKYSGRAIGIALTWAVLLAGAFHALSVAFMSLVFTFGRPYL